MSILDDPDAVAALGAWRALKDAPDADLSAYSDWAHDIRRAVARGSVGLSIDLAALRGTDLDAEEIADLRQVWQSAAADFELGQPNYRLRLHVVTENSAQAPAIANLLAKAHGVGLHYHRGSHACRTGALGPAAQHRCRRCRGARCC